MTAHPDTSGARQRQNVVGFGVCMACIAALAGCTSEAPSADTLELATMWQGNVIPKSTPRELVLGFDQFCVKTPSDIAARETALRDAGYVPTSTTAGEARQVFVIDNRAPAIGISPNMCIARSTARTGQTNAVNRYVSATFPEATPTDPGQLPVDVEQAWAIDGGILATARNRWIGNRSSYSVILFQPGGTS
ncbi:MAG: hypothetical protein AAF727_15580 [Pseudomonadota bacterium]